MKLQRNKSFYIKKTELADYDEIEQILDHIGMQSTIELAKRMANTTVIVHPPRPLHPD